MTQKYDFFFFFFCEEMSTIWTGSPVFCYSCAFGYMATRDVITRSEGLPLPGRGGKDKVGQDAMPPYLHR